MFKYKSNKLNKIGGLFFIASKQFKNKLGTNKKVKL